MLVKDLIEQLSNPRIQDLEVFVRMQCPNCKVWEGDEIKDLTIVLDEIENGGSIDCVIIEAPIR